VKITRSTPIPIATGERNATHWGFRQIVENKAAAVLQPDVRHCGGILEIKKTGEWRLRTMRRHPEDDSFSDF